MGPEGPDICEGGRPPLAWAGCGIGDGEAEGLAARAAKLDTPRLLADCCAGALLLTAGDDGGLPELLMVPN